MYVLRRSANESQPTRRWSCCGVTFDPQRHSLSDWAASGRVAVPHACRKAAVEVRARNPVPPSCFQHRHRPIERLQENGGGGGRTNESNSSFSVLEKQSFSQCVQKFWVCKMFPFIIQLYQGGVWLALNSFWSSCRWGTNISHEKNNKSCSRRFRPHGEKEDVQMGFPKYSKQHVCQQQPSVILNPVRSQTQAYVLKKMKQDSFGKNFIIFWGVSVKMSIFCPLIANIWKHNLNK